MFRLALIAMLLMGPLGALAQGSGWDVTVEPLPAPPYKSGGTFDPDAKAAYDAGMAQNAAREAAIKEQVKSTLDSVDVWSQKSGYPAPTNRVAWVQASCNTTPFALSSSTPDSAGAGGDRMTILWKAIDRKRFRSVNESTITMAHELMHMIQFGPWRSAFLPRPVSQVQWITESTSEAFAGWYLMSQGTSAAKAALQVARPTDYTTPLYYPAQNAVNAMTGALGDVSRLQNVDIEGYDRSDECFSSYRKVNALSDMRGDILVQDYRRAEFFFFLGVDLDRATPQGWLGRAAGKPLDHSENGVRWLEDIIKTESKGRWKGLFEYWPAFVARHADNLDRHFITYNMDPLDFRPANEGDTKDYDGNVEGLAADPREITLNFEAGPWPVSRKRENQVFMLVQEFEKPASADDPRTLVVDAQAVDKPRPYKRAVWANPDAGELKVLNRVANASKQAWESAPIDYKVKLSLERVRWDPPRCVVVGQPFTVALNPKDSGVTQQDIADQIRNGYAKWEIDGPGRIVDEAQSQFVIDAPGVAKISFVLRYKSGSKTRELPIRVVTLEATGDDCQIQTKVPGQPFAMTYSRKRDYSETVVDDGSKIYFGVGRIAANIPSEGGWMNIPPAAQAMMHAQFNTQFGSLPEPPPWAATRDEGFFARLPLVFQRWWDMRNLTDAMEDDPAIAAMAEWACPSDVKECREIRINGTGAAVLTYDQMDRLARLATADATMNFAFGQFDMGRPPGWEDRPNFEEPAAAAAIPDAPSNPIAPAAASGGAASSVAATGGLASSGSACDCSCGAIPQTARKPMCLQQCAPVWAQCKP